MIVINSNGFFIHKSDPNYISICISSIKNEILRNYKNKQIIENYLEISYIDSFQVKELFNKLSNFLPENFFDTNCIKLYQLSLKEDEKIQVVIFFGEKERIIEFEDFYRKLPWVESLTYIEEMPPKVTNLEAIKSYWN